MNKVVLGSSPVAVTQTSDFAPASSKEFLDIQATIECGFTLKRLRDMIRIYSHYKDCLLKNEIILKSQQRFRSEAQNVYTEEINKIALNNNDDKKLQTFDRITSCLYETSAGN